MGENLELPWECRFVTAQTPSLIERGGGHWSLSGAYVLRAPRPVVENSRDLRSFFERAP